MMLNLKCGMLILTVFCDRDSNGNPFRSPQTPKGVRYFARISFLNVMIKKKNIPQKYISFGVQ